MFNQDLSFIYLVVFIFSISMLINVESIFASIIVERDGKIIEKAHLTRTVAPSQYYSSKHIRRHVIK